MNYSETDIIANADGAIYHLGLLPNQIAETIIFVGDPDRVGQVSRHFDSIEFKIERREFVTHTGILGGGRLTVISTGIGVDNIELVAHELDMLANFDFEKRQFRPNLKTLNFIRIGTSGSIQNEVEIDTILISKMAMGMDNLMAFYDPPQNSRELDWADSLANYFEQKSEDLLLMPYAFEADKDLLDHFSSQIPTAQQGVTLTAPGFYAPQGRAVRVRVTDDKLLQHLSNFKKGKTNISNLEMETSAIYGMARALGHRAVSLNAILANRINQQFSPNPQQTIDNLIQLALNAVKNLEKN